MPVERALSIGRQIAAALEAAHRCEVVHRDLKPDNVLVISRGSVSDFVKVLDFGIAKLTVEGSGATSPQLTRVGSIFGTPQYMSPEQAAGQAVDHRADLYSLGLMIHEMIRGRPVFESPEIIGLLTKQMTEAPPPLPSTPIEPASLIFQLLEKDPARRPQTAAEVVARIDAWLGPTSRAADSVVGVTAPVSGASPAASARTGLDAGRFGGATTVLERLDAVRVRARPVVERVRQAAGPALARFRPLMERLATVGKRRIAGGRVPIWVVAGGAVGIGAIVAVLSVDTLPKGEGTASSASATQAEVAGAKDEEKAEAADESDEEADEPSADTGDMPIDEDLRQAIAAARGGNPHALMVLEMRDKDKRTTAEWLALAQGRLKKREIPEALKAYEVALERQPRLMNDPRMVSGLRYFADKDSTFNIVLGFAAEHMGATGGDIIFHVWSATSRKTQATEKALELLMTDEVRKNASEALSIALQLREAKSCQDYKKLLPAVERSADRRSLLRLRELKKTEGCGPSGEDDCYPCLRADGLLEAATSQAEMRAAPQFRLRRRWR